MKNGGKMTEIKKKKNLIKIYIVYVMNARVFHLRTNKKKQINKYNNNYDNDDEDDNNNNNSYV